MPLAPGHSAQDINSRHEEKYRAVKRRNDRVAGRMIERQDTASGRSWRTSMAVL